MPYYVPEKDFEPHDFTTSVLSVTSPDLDGTTPLEDIDTIEVELDEDKWAVQTVSSGQSIDVKKPGRAGTIKLTFLDASPSSGTMSLLSRSDSPFRISFTDKNAPDLNCSCSQSRVRKHAMVKRSSDVDVPEWTVQCRVLKCETGGYRLQTVA